MRTLFVIIILFVSASAFAGDKREIGPIRRTIRGFSKIDTAYIEPQHYNWSLMTQATWNYDFYILESEMGQRVVFSPDILMKIGPYFGWRWVFLGYTFDLKRLGLGDGGAKKEINFSLYSSQIGVDVFYRKTGSDYKIRTSDLGKGIDTRQLDDVDFNGLEVGITGLNVYYIFNHNRFSYPAAFAQSTIQKISCGSWMAGVGYTRHSLDLDYDKLQAVVDKKLGAQNVALDSSLMYSNVKYYDINASVGYGYNWVFAKNWLFASSMSAALGYKRATSSMDTDDKSGFDFNNFNIDGILRLGLVYNNMRWYAGSSLVVHAYNYRKSRFATNNIFGNLNVYVGVNFGARGKYKKSRK